MNRNELNQIMRELAEYSRIADETAAVIDGLKDKLKAYMTETGTDTVIGDEHKASYKSIITNRVDTAALKKELPDIAARFTKASSSMRFTFA